MLVQQKSTQHYKIIIFQFKEKIHCRRKPAYQGYNCHCQEQGLHWLSGGINDGPQPHIQ